MNAKSYTKDYPLLPLTIKTEKIDFVKVFIDYANKNNII